MMLHPNAAVRVLRNELERLAEARHGCAAEIARRDCDLTMSLAERLSRIRTADAAAEIAAQIDAEAAEIYDALAILEAGFEAEQGFLAFDTAAA